jgi:hypothetical protein
MKNTDHLKGAIDMIIADFNVNQYVIPNDYKLHYNVCPVLSAKVGEEGKTKAYKVVFTYISGQVITNSDSTGPFAEDEYTDDYFTILTTESLLKLQSYVQDILTKVIETEIKPRYK